jgi:hypothetical protein
MENKYWYELEINGQIHLVNEEIYNRVMNPESVKSELPIAPEFDSYEELPLD